MTECRSSSRIACFFLSNLGTKTPSYNDACRLNLSILVTVGYILGLLISFTPCTLAYTSRQHSRRKWSIARPLPLFGRPVKAKKCYKTAEKRLEALLVVF